MDIFSLLSIVNEAHIPLLLQVTVYSEKYIIQKF